MGESNPPAGFSGPVMVSHGELDLPVYTSTAGEKPLIALHELPGMTEPFLAFSRTMADKGYKMVIPLLFNEPGQKMSNKEARAFCVSQEFKDLFAAAEGSGGGRPFTAWLLHLTRQVLAENPGRKVGVVGMCLTGGFALAAIAEERVGAAVACQPAFPFFRGIRTLGLSEEERRRASERARGLAALEGRPCLKGYRYRWDLICRPSHMRAAQRIFGPAFERHPNLPGRGHSTVTRTPPDPAVMGDLEAFLEARL